MFQVGKMNWKTKLKSPVITEGLIDNDILYSATLGSVAILKVESGAMLKEIESHPIFSTPVISGDNIIVANVTGKVIWLDKDTTNQVDISN